MKIKQIFSFETFSAKYQHFKSSLVTLNSDKSSPWKPLIVLNILNYVISLTILTCTLSPLTQISLLHGNHHTCDRVAMLQLEICKFLAGDWTYMHIFRHIFLSNYWWQRSDIWSQASYRYPISWEVFLDPSDSYFLFAEERGYHKWALAHSSSC
jgi:hypothetical protein